MGSNPLQRAIIKFILFLSELDFFAVLLKRIRKGRFAARQIATFRGMVAKSVGVSAALPSSESSARHR